MTRGRCGSLLLHRDGLAPSTPCRSPGALRFTPVNGHRQFGPAGPFRANNGLLHRSNLQLYFDHLIGAMAAASAFTFLQ
jgi:hypothetical protein